MLDLDETFSKASHEYYEYFNIISSSINMSLKTSGRDLEDIVGVLMMFLMLDLHETFIIDSLGCHEYPDIISIKSNRVATHRLQLLFQNICNR